MTSETSSVGPFKKETTPLPTGLGVKELSSTDNTTKSIAPQKLEGIPLTPPPHSLNDGGINSPSIGSDSSIKATLPMSVNELSTLDHLGTDTLLPHSKSSPTSVSPVNLLALAEKELAILRDNPPKRSVVNQVEKPLLSPLQSDQEFEAFLKTNFVQVRTNVNSKDILSSTKGAQIVFFAEKHNRVEDREKNGQAINTLAASSKTSSDKEIIVLAEGSGPQMGSDQLEFVSHPAIPVASWDAMPPEGKGTYARLAYAAQIGLMITKNIFAAPRNEKGVSNQIEETHQCLELLAKHCGANVDQARKNIENLIKKYNADSISLSEVRNGLVTEMCTILNSVLGDINKDLNSIASRSETERQVSLLANIMLRVEEGYSKVAVVAGRGHVHPLAAKLLHLDPQSVTQIYDFLNSKNIPYVVLDPVREEGPIQTITLEDGVTLISLPFEEDELVMTKKNLSPKEQYAELTKRVASQRGEIMKIDRERLGDTPDSGLLIRISLTLSELMRSELDLIEFETNNPKIVNSKDCVIQ